MIRGEFEIVGEVVRLALKREDGTLIFNQLFRSNHEFSWSAGEITAIVDPAEKVALFGLKLELDIRPLKGKDQ